MAARIVELTRHAIHAWRGLAGLDKSGDIDSAAAHNVAQLIGISA
jgi:hypothetical protein